MDERGEVMNVSEAIRTKRAVRKFREEALPEDVARAILNAGRRSQSSKNEQGWQFIAIRNKSVLEALSECGTWAGHLAGAALGVAIVFVTGRITRRPTVDDDAREGEDVRGDLQLDARPDDRAQREVEDESDQPSEGHRVRIMESAKRIRSDTEV